MTGEHHTSDRHPESERTPGADLRRVSVAWETLEDAFENNSPDVSSYLHIGTGEVLRVVDGLADQDSQSRISADSMYLRVEPVSSREQYRWMERFITTIDEGPFRQKLQAAIDGKGAFRRFKDVLLSSHAERERWFQFRSERLRASMEGWLEAQGLLAVERPEWEVPSPDEVKPQLDAIEKARRAARSNAAEAQRRHLRDLVDLIPVRELEAAAAFLEFLRDRRPVRRAMSRDSNPVPRESNPVPSDEGGSRVS